jgi:MarR family transcriptional regulator, organic hydroperoxide resistance regulator
MQPVVERFQHAIQTIRRSLESQVLQRMKSDITAPQMFVLYFIHQKMKCKLTQIAEKMEVKPSAVTVMIDRLENAGYVRRVSDPADRRSTLVELTPEGQQVLDKAVSQRNEILSTFLSKLEPEEQELVTGLLEKMTQTTAKE